MNSIEGWLADIDLPRWLGWTYLHPLESLVPFFPPTFFFFQPYNTRTTPHISPFLLSLEELSI